MTKKFAFALVFILFISTTSLYASAGPIPYKDVKSTDWYASSIQWASDQNIVNGFPDKSFRPNDSVTEEQFLTMLARVNKFSGDPYDDARSRNLPIYYKLNLPITRAEAAVYLSTNMGYVDSNQLTEGAIQYLMEKGIAKGTTNTTLNIKSFNGDRLLTRAEAVTFIQRTVQSNLTLDQKLSEMPDIKYPKSVIINGNNTKQFAELVSHLPEIENIFDKIDNVEVDGVHVVEVYENKYNGPDSAAYIIHKSPIDNYVSIFVRYNNDLSQNATLAVLQLYVSKEESEVLLDEYLQYAEKFVNNEIEGNEIIPYPTQSKYQISFTYGAIEIMWKGDSK